MGYHIQAIGIPHLSTAYSGFKVIDIKTKLNDYRTFSSLTDEKLSRTSSSLDLLIGSDMAELHPVRAATIGKLVILRSDFGSGWSVMGSSSEHVKFTDNYVGTRTNYCGVEDMRVQAEAAPKTCKMLKLGKFILPPNLPDIVNKPPRKNTLIKTKSKVKPQPNPSNDIKPKRTYSKKKE